MRPRRVQPKHLSRPAFEKSLVDRARERAEGTVQHEWVAIAAVLSVPVPGGSDAAAAAPSDGRSGQYRVTCTRPARW